MYFQSDWYCLIMRNLFRFVIPPFCFTGMNEFVFVWECWLAWDLSKLLFSLLFCPWHSIASEACVHQKVTSFFFRSSCPQPPPLALPSTIKFFKTDMKTRRVGKGLRVGCRKRLFRFRISQTSKTRRCLRTRFNYFLNKP